MTTNLGDTSPYGPGFKGGVDALNDKALATRLRGYKRHVAKRYRTVIPGRETRDIPKAPMFISRKLDGELWFLLKRDGQVLLLAYNGRIVGGVPVTDEASERLAEVGEILIPGELYVPGTHERARVHNVARTLSDGSQAERLQFAPFDLLEEDGNDLFSEEYAVRWRRLHELFAGAERCAPPETEEAEEPASVAAHYASWVETKQCEGLVVRHSFGTIYKVKPIVTVDACVVAFGERKTAEVGTVRELTVALRRDDGGFHILGTVSTGLEEADRVTWHTRLSAMEVESSYRMANREGTLCRWVRPEIVLELKCSDLLHLDDSERPVRRMVVSYDEERGYEAEGLMPFLSLIHPVIVREREDKKPVVEDIGLSQVYSIVPFAEHDQPAEQIDLAKTEVVDRKVWTKATKGKTAVRKYVAMATHKHETDPDYPPFVVHFTDFSPSRKDPLKTGLRVASSRERLDSLVEGWVKDNIKRGWKEA